jgi:hypothetical protein
MKNHIKLSKIIFNTKMNIIVNKNKKYYRNLIKELTLYPESKEYKSIINIYIDTKKKPTTKIFNKDIFTISTRFLDIFWIYKDTKIKNIIIITKYDKTNILFKFAYYLLGKDLAAPENIFTKDLHELVFVPTQFFNLENTIIHGSCININKTSILGGVGGVGKTSATLSLKGTQTTFISDDMIIIDKYKKTYPNYAFPKIYAYNLENNKKLKKKILKSSSIINKLLFNIIGYISKSKVRKRIDPRELYTINNMQDYKINNYYLLNKTDIKYIKIIKVNSRLLSKLSWQIIEMEYSYIINQLLLHDLNCQIFNVKNNFDYKKIKINKLNINNNIFNKTNNCIIQIPKNIKHKDYLNQIKKILME